MTRCVRHTISRVCFCDVFNIFAISAACDKDELMTFWGQKRLKSKNRLQVGDIELQVTDDGST